MKNSRIVLVAAVGVATALMLTGCGGTGKSQTVLNTSDGQAAQNAGGNLGVAGNGAAAPGGEYVNGASSSSAGVLTSALATRTSAAVGTIVTDGKGWTLYRYDKDSATPARSNCNGTCAKAWPPALTSGTTPQLTGVKASLVGKVRRSDGTWQLTLAGWPLYRYAKDTGAGSWKGIGVKSTWWAVSPSGKRVQKCKPGMGANSGDKANSGNKANNANKANKGRGKSNNTNVNNNVNVNVNVNINVINQIRVVNINNTNIVVNGDGRAMYRYDRDSLNRSRCTGSCLKSFTPVAVSRQRPQLQGVAAGLVGSILRADGIRQLTVAGMPMYFFNGDTNFGDLKAQGRSGLWWAVQANGSRMKA